MSRSILYPTAQAQKPHEGSELQIFVIVQLGPEQENTEKPRQFLKSRNCVVDCVIPFWKPDWLFSCIPEPAFAASSDDTHWDENALPTKLCLFRRNNDTDWCYEHYQIWGKLYPYHLKVIRPMMDSTKLSAEYFPIIQAQQEHMQQLPFSEDLWQRTAPNLVNFIGEVDQKTWTLKPGLLEPQQQRLAGFMRLTSYVNSGTDRSPNRGYYTFHVLVFFPVTELPHKLTWKSVIVDGAAGPFTTQQYLSISGSIVGKLSTEAVVQRLHGFENILVIAAHNHQYLPGPTNRSASTASTPYTSPRKGSSLFKQPEILDGNSETAAPQTPSKQKANRNTKETKLNKQMSHDPTTNEDDNRITQSSLKIKSSFKPSKEFSRKPKDTAKLPKENLETATALQDESTSDGEIFQLNEQIQNEDEYASDTYIKQEPGTVLLADDKSDFEGQESSFEEISPTTAHGSEDDTAEDDNSTQQLKTKKKAKGKRKASSEETVATRSSGRKRRQSQKAQELD